MDRRFPGLFLQVPEDFSLLFCYFCMCPCLVLEWAKKRSSFAFFFFFKFLLADFFPNPFVSPTQPKDGKLSLSLQKTKRFFLFLFRRQNGKSCSMSSGSDEAGFPLGAGWGDSPGSNRGLCPPRSSSLRQDRNWLSPLCLPNPGWETGS